MEKTNEIKNFVLEKIKKNINKPLAKLIKKKIEIKETK